MYKVELFSKAKDETITNNIFQWHVDLFEFTLQFR